MTVAEIYDRIAPIYDTAPNPLLALEQRVLAPLLPVADTIVDVGAGTGRWLRRLQASRTMAIDLSAAMLSSAPGQRIQADATRLPLRNSSADLVLCTFTLGYAPTCFTELARITRPGGTLVVTDVHPDAIARGWSRSFRNGNEVFEPEHHSYSIEALTHPGLLRTNLVEPHLGEPERPIFAAAGKFAAFEAACRRPAIFVAIWTKQ